MAMPQQGTGTHTFGDGTYTGEWCGGKRHGQGIMAYTNGDRYEGAWDNDDCHGFGTCTWADGDRYEGAYDNGKQHGFGTFTWADGGRYEGAWENDKFHGFGTYTWASGGRYEGAFDNDKFHGHGTKTWASGNRYEGEFSNNDGHGKGVFTAAKAGWTLTGAFAHWRPTEGELTLADGRRFAVLYAADCAFIYNHPTPSSKTLLADAEHPIETSGVLQAAKDGAFDKFAKLLKSQTHLSFEDFNSLPPGRTFGVVHQIAFHGNRAALEALLTAHPRVDLKMLTKDGTTAEEVAVEEGTDASFLGFLRDCARLHDVDWRVQRAGAEAVQSFDSLRFLGATFQLVKAKRSRRSHLHETVEAFRGLVDALKGQFEATHHPNAHAANVTMAAREAQEGAERQRRELAASQSKIQHHVASFVQGLGKAVIDCLQELPEGLQAEMRSRNLLRAQHSRELRLAQARLLQAGAESARGLHEAGAHSTCMSDLGERVRAKLMAKEEQLKKAIDEARAGMVRYNTTQVRGTTEGRVAMGESAVPTAAEGGEVGSALDGYDEWVASYLHDDDARMSDAAMKELQKQLADKTTMSAVLGLQEERMPDLEECMCKSTDIKAYLETKFKVQCLRPGSEPEIRVIICSDQYHDMFEDLASRASERFGLAKERLFFKYTDSEGDTISVRSIDELKQAISQFPSSTPKLTLCTEEQGGGLKTALQSAAAAIEREREHQLSDPLAFFPCTALMNAGRLLLDAWQAHRAAFEQLTTVHRVLEVDLAMNEECLDQSGTLCKEKDRVLQELRDARGEHDNAAVLQDTLSPALKSGNEPMIRKLSQALGMQEVPTLQGLRRNVREKHLILTRVILKLTGKIQYHFPEVILFVGQGLPPDLSVLWRPAQTLESFDSKELVSSDAKHKVWRVRIGDEHYAIKEYAIGQPTHLQTCLQEVAIIYRYRHPYIVQVNAIFQGSGSEQGNFYLQMPWYDNGTLEQWSGGDCRPEWTQVRSVLLDVLVGLVHLHAHGVIHGDVKPANILVDSRERGLLADFDISIDTKSRTSAAHVTRKSTIGAVALGMTAGFAAPELQTSGQATRHTDMFAYGKTVSQVGAQCEPGDAAAAQGAEGILDQARGQSIALVGALTAASPSDRPSAEAATQHPFFTILGAACQCIPKTCSICFCLADSAAGVECSEGHFHCDSCVARHAETFLDFDNLRQRKEREGHLKCSKFPLECNSGFADRDLAKLLHIDLFKTYLEARVETIKAQMQAQLNAEMKDRLEAELQRLAALDEQARKVHVARKHIIEEILTLKCPRCSLAFLNFDACFALKCNGCPCHFCAYCLKDCGDDAHGHVANCQHNIAPGKNVFADQHTFDRAQKDRKTRLLKEYMSQMLEAGLRNDVKQALLRELRDLGLENVI